MSIPAPAPPGVYHSRSRVTRRRAALAAAGLALLLLGYFLGRLQDGPSTPAPAAAAPAGSAQPSPSVAAPSPSPSEEVPVGGTDAYTTIQAESATNQQGTQAEDTEDEGGGQDVGWINNGDWLRYDQVNFGATPATRFAVRVASDVGDGVTGRVDLHLDSPASTPIGGLTVGNMGGWQKWQTQTTMVTPTTGMHTLFLTFASDSGTEFLNLNYFAFGH
ncbi:carbohydrate-binding protein [Couchioplanes caeruleus]|uniref:carbohydrate-binding protein n=1 Tax=Couchioplanes caeruleus TaxID=56438 RepID=UPI00201BCFF6|nr:carbohydrate-binding protein [Couchioplanes caeruleus]UQU66565.1 carbohydrate-binding protein [Couchioplanes caeruleus]